MAITKGTQYITDPNTIPVDTNFASDVLPTLLNTLDTNTTDHINSTSAHASSNITYDNASSGLTATNTKDALDEIDSNLDSHLSSSTAHDASEIVYDNTSSGLSAATSQAAIDEIENRVDTVESGKVDTDSEASLLNIAREEFTTATTGSLNLDVSTTSSFLVDVIGTIDITLSGTTADKTHQVYVEAINSGGSLTWTTSITWDGGSEPALGTNFTIYYLVYIGGTWYGKAIISN